MYIDDQYQLMYANVIFIGITSNLMRANQLITNNYQDTSS